MVRWPLAVTLGLCLAGVVLLGMGTRFERQNELDHGLALTWVNYEAVTGANQRIVFTARTNGGDHFDADVMKADIYWLGALDSPNPEPVPEGSHPVRFLPAEAGMHLPGEGFDDEETPKGTPGAYIVEGVGLGKAGGWRIDITARSGDDEFSGSLELVAHDDTPVAARGDTAPDTHQALPDDPDANLAAIDSRAGRTLDVPEPTVHDQRIDELKDAHLPFVVIVSSPAFCSADECDDLMTQMEGLAEEFEPKVAVVHLELWQDYNSETMNDAALEWITPGGDRTPSEPWVFLVNQDGRIVDRWDHVVDIDLLRRQMEALATTQPVPLEAQAMPTGDS